MRDHPAVPVSRLRRFLFWFHLVLGLACAAVLLVTATTGAALALEQPVLRHLSRDLRRVAPAGHALPVADWLDAIDEYEPDLKISELRVSADPGEAAVLTAGRAGLYYANPYTAEITEPDDAGARDFFKLMLTWHRWLGMPERARDTAGERTGVDWRGHAATVVGAASIGLVLLAISGLVIWFPNRLKPAAWRFAAVPRFTRPGHAAYGNWHRVIGWWTLPAVLLTAMTGAALGFRAIADTLAKRPDPAEAARVDAFDPQARRATPDALLKSLRERFPDARAYTLRLGGGRARGRGDAKPAPQGVTAAVEEPGRLTDTAVVLHPLTGAIVRVTRDTDLPAGRLARQLLKPLHTGAWGGALGVAAALTAALSTLALTLTGLALSWRRFRPKKRPARAA